MITGIKEQPQPAFDFDLSNLVLQQLSPKKIKTSNDKLLAWIIVFIGLSVLSATLYYFQTYFSPLFEGINTIIIYLISITAVTVLTALFIDMYKNYNKEMKLLDSY
jgi:hypothetical protein